jgi:hypothetical protein
MRAWLFAEILQSYHAPFLKEAGNNRVITW